MGRFLKISATVALALPFCLLQASPPAFAQKVKPSSVRQQADVIPSTTAGKQLKRLLKTVNQADSKELKDFLTNGFSQDEPTPVEQRVQHVEMLRQQIGKLSVSEVIDSQPMKIEVRCEGSKGKKIHLGIQVESEKPHRISKVKMRILKDRSKYSEKLTQQQKAQMVAAVAKALKQKYVFPEKGKQMAEALEKSLSEKQYDEIEDRIALANHLTKQLREICNDLHLRIRSTSPSPPKKQGNLFLDNHGFVKAEMLPSSIGYLRFDYFSSHPEAKDTAAAAMNFLANSKTLIIDLRWNRGGSPEMIAFLTSYLVDKKTHLNSFYNRPSDTTTESWTKEKVPGKTLGSTVPVYVLTSKRSFSGAEEFSYNLKHLQRGTLVGETTGGGAHPVRMESLPAGFFISVPFARAINPITKTNWEGVGVVPHVKVSSTDALKKALELAKSKKTFVKKLVQSESESNKETLARIRGRAREFMNDQDFQAASGEFQKIEKQGKMNASDNFNYGYCLHAQGELEKALKYHQLAAKTERFAAIATYNIACVHAIQHRKDKAFKALEKAHKLGFGSARQLKEDSDLDSLRSDPRFKEFLKKFDQ